MAQGKISAKQQEILEYIKHRFWSEAFRRLSVIFAKQFI